VPWYAFTAGALGLLIVGSIGYVVPRLGLAPGFTLITASQFLLAALIDHFGLFGATARPLDLTRGLGLVILLVAVWLIMR
jgi:transporter family-2 protein